MLISSEKYLPTESKPMFVQTTGYHSQAKGHKNQASQLVEKQKVIIRLKLDNKGLGRYSTVPDTCRSFYYCCVLSPVTNTIVTNTTPHITHAVITITNDSMS